MHSRPKAAMVRGWARKNAAPSRRAASSSSRSSGVGGPLRVWMRCLRSALCSRPNSRLLIELVLLALAQRLDGQPELLLGLVHRLVVEVGDAGVDLQHGLRDAQLVLAGRELVVDEGARQHGLAVVAGGKLDGGLARACPAASSRGALNSLDVAAAAPATGATSASNDLLRQREHGARGDGLGGEVPVRPATPAAPGRRSGRRRRARRARSRRRTCRRRACSTLPCAIRRLVGRLARLDDAPRPALNSCCTKRLGQRASAPPRPRSRAAAAARPAPAG